MLGIPQKTQALLRKALPDIPAWKYTDHGGGERLGISLRNLFENSMNSFDPNKTKFYESVCICSGGLWVCMIYMCV